MRRAFDDIASDFTGLGPGGWRRRSGCLLRTGGQAQPDPYYAAGHSRLLSLLLWDEVISFPHGVVLPFALLGLAVTWRPAEPGPSTCCGFFLAGYGLSIVLFFVTSPLPHSPDPGLAAVRRGRAAWIASHVRARNWRPAAAASAAVLAAGIALNLPASAPHLGGRAAAPRPRRGHAAQGALARVACPLPRAPPSSKPGYASPFTTWRSPGSPRAPAAGGEGEPAAPSSSTLPAPPPGFTYARSLWAQGDRDSALAQLGETVRAAPGPRGSPPPPRPLAPPSRTR